MPLTAISPWTTGFRVKLIIIMSMDVRGVTTVAILSQTMRTRLILLYIRDRITTLDVNTTWKISPRSSSRRLPSLRVVWIRIGPGDQLH